MSQPYHYPGLSYFLDHYWHENADILYSRFEDALIEFSQLETQDYLAGLLVDLRHGLQDDLFADSFDDPCYSQGWWKTFANLMSAEQARQAERFLAERVGARS
jgi:hypothetical protein